MKIIMETSLERFEAWSGGEDTLEVLREKDLCEQLENILEGDIFPDGCTDTELNDVLWFERDTIAEWLGFYNWEALENEGEEEEEEEEEEENNFSKWCNNNGYVFCNGCPYENCISVSDCEEKFYEDNPEQEDGRRGNWI